MNPAPDMTQCIVSERLKYVDLLVKAGRFGDAIKEIAGTKQIDPVNPYVQAYEERLQSMSVPLPAVKECASANSIQAPSSKQFSPASPGLNQQHATHECADDTAVQIDELLRIANRQQVRALDSSSGRGESPDHRSGGRATIVLVDDDELMLAALVELFEENKYGTKTFTRSEDALEYLKGHTPDLILCDVNLQKSAFGGFTLLEKMSKLGHLHNVPFVFMSGLGDQAIIRAGKELGADDYLTKPFEPEMLLSVVKGKLKKYKLMAKNH